MAKYDRMTKDQLKDELYRRAGVESNLVLAEEKLAFLLKTAKAAEKQLATFCEPIASCELINLRKAIFQAERATK